MKFSYYWSHLKNSAHYAGTWSRQTRKTQSYQICIKSFNCCRSLRVVTQKALWNNTPCSFYYEEDSKLKTNKLRRGAVTVIRRIVLKGRPVSFCDYCSDQNVLVLCASAQYSDEIQEKYDFNGCSRMSLVNLLSYIRKCAHIFIHIHTYIHTYIRTYIHLHTHARARVHIHIHMYVHTYIHAHIHIHVHIHIHMYILTYVHAHIHTCTHIYIHT